MTPNMQFTLILLAMFVAYFIYWTVQSVIETRKVRYIIDHGKKYRVYVKDVDARSNMFGGKYDLYVAIPTEKGDVKLKNYPRIRKSPYTPGSEVEIHYCPEYRGEFVFADDFIPNMRPISVIKGGRILWDKYIIRSILTFVICGAIILFGLYFFGEPPILH